MSDLLESPTTGKRPRRRVIVAALLAALAVGFVLFWFQPQKLLIDDRVEEAVPEAAAPESRGTGTTEGVSPRGSQTTSGEPSEVARGEFVSLDHDTSGAARILALEDGRRVVRLEGLDTDNGPDLYLYLTANPAAGDEGAFDDDFVNLGRLKGNQGDQNYDLPGGTDLERYGTVVIWCDRFNSAFGAADIRREPSS